MSYARLFFRIHHQENRRPTKLRASQILVRQPRIERSYVFLGRMEVSSSRRDDHPTYGSCLLLDAHHHQLLRPGRRVPESSIVKICFLPWTASFESPRRLHWLNVAAAELRLTPPSGSLKDGVQQRIHSSLAGRREVFTRRPDLTLLILLAVRWHDGLVPTAAKEKQERPRTVA